MITFDTVLESWDFILYNEKILGTIGVPLWVPFGTQSTLVNVKNLKKSIFWFSKIHYNGTQNGTPMVPKVSNGTQTVPKWYPNSLTHFFKWWFFIIFQVQKMAIWPLWPQFWVPSRNFGYHRYFFRNTYHVSYLRKKRRSLSRDIYLPSLIFLIFYQIHNFHLWDKLHFLGTIEYSMVPKNFTIVKYEVSAF